MTRSIYWRATATSIGITVSTGAFALFAVLGLFCAVSVRGTEMNRVNYWFAATSSVLHCIVASYLLSFGIIGLMTWA